MTWLGPLVRRAYAVIVAVTLTGIVAAALWGGARLWTSTPDRPKDPPMTGSSAPDPVETPTAAPGGDGAAVETSGAWRLLTGLATALAGRPVPGVVDLGPCPFTSEVFASLPGSYQGSAVTVLIAAAGRGSPVARDAANAIADCAGQTPPPGAGDAQGWSLRDGDGEWHIRRWGDIVTVTVGTYDAEPSVTAATLTGRIAAAGRALGCTPGAGDTPYRDGTWERPADIVVATLSSIPAPAATGPAPERTPVTITSGPAQPVLELAPLLTREQGGDGTTTGEAPLLVDPDSVTLPPMPDPQTRDAGPAPTNAAGELTVTTATWTDPAEGPGCGWAFTLQQPPAPISPDTARAIRIDAWWDTAGQARDALEATIAWPDTFARWQALNDAVNAWKAYDETLAAIETAWAQARSARQASEDAWRKPAPSPSPTAPGPTLEPSGRDESDAR